MHHRLALTICLCWSWSLAAASDIAVLSLPSDPFSGVSGLEVTEDGTGFVAVRDDGTLVHGNLVRDAASNLTGIETTSVVQMAFEQGASPHRKRDRDAEGIALDAQGNMHVSMEGRHRVLHYTRNDSGPESTRLPASHKTYSNTGFEALAIDIKGRLVTLPEASESVITAYPIWRQSSSGEWEIVGSLPREGGFRPVGADIGPDGALYVLTRAFSGFSFATRVHRSPSPEISDQWQTVFRSPHGEFGNLEGIAVWRDSAGETRMLLVSDNNFRAMQRAQLIELTLRKRLP